MKALDKYREIFLLLKDKHLDFPEKQAEEILLHVLRIKKSELYIKNPDITEQQEKLINSLIKRRLSNEPLQYILGECEFYGLKIKVGKGVLIPRPETEILVEEFLKRKKEILSINSKILDLCTGSGCIALAIAKNLKNSKVYGIDISPEAISYAVESKKLNNIKNVYFFVGDLFSPLKSCFAAITVNPPYVTSAEISELHPQIKYYEPREALDGGQDGLDFYRRILKEAKNYMYEGSFLFMELGAGQSESVRKIAEDNGFKVIDIVEDLANIKRVMILKK